MLQNMHDLTDGDYMAEVIGLYTAGALGREATLKALFVEYMPQQSRAVIWADLRDQSISGQLEALDSFADVRECYDDEIEVELRFGVPVHADSSDVASRKMAFA